MDSIYTKANILKGLFAVVVIIVCISVLAICNIKIQSGLSDDEKKQSSSDSMHDNNESRLGSKMHAPNEPFTNNHTAQDQIADVSEYNSMSKEKPSAEELAKAKEEKRDIDNFIFISQWSIVCYLLTYIGGFIDILVSIGNYIGLYIEEHELLIALKKVANMFHNALFLWIATVILAFLIYKKKLLKMIYLQIYEKIKNFGIYSGITNVCTLENLDKIDDAIYNTITGVSEYCAICVGNVCSKVFSTIKNTLDIYIESGRTNIIKAGNLFASLKFKPESKHIYYIIGFFIVGVGIYYSELYVFLIFFIPDIVNAIITRSTDDYMDVTLGASCKT